VPSLKGLWHVCIQRGFEEALIVALAPNESLKFFQRCELSIFFNQPAQIANGGFGILLAISLPKGCGFDIGVIIPGLKDLNKELLNNLILCLISQKYWQLLFCIGKKDFPDKADGASGAFDIEQHML
jgi:hypothetical protein